MVKIGERAPEFSLPAADGGNISLKDLRGKKVVLYFYPKDDTPGCTKEACSFRDNLGSLRKKGAEVIGVSADSSESHAKFSRKYDLPFPLLSDAAKSMMKAYGVWKQKSFMGRKYMGIERTTVIIDAKGVVAHVFEKVKVAGHTEEIMSILENV